MATKVKTGVIDAGAITSALITDASITADDLHTTLDLTGKTVTVSTATAGDNDTSVASTAYVDVAIANLADSAPSTLNTLNELAAALGDDANFSTTVTNSIATKLPLAGGTMSGALNISGGTVNGTSFADNRLLRLQNTSTTDGSRMGIAFQGNSSIGSGLAWIEGVNYDQSIGATDIRFSTYSGSAWNADMMTLSNNGNVGIGTAGPTALLHVKKDVDSFIMKVENDGNSAGTSGASYADASDGLWVDTRWNTSTNTPFKVTSNSGTTPMMIIKGDGKVGIGTDTPSARLDVRGGSGTGTHTHAVFTGTTGRGLAIKSGLTGGQHNGKAILDAQDTEAGGASMDFQIAGITKLAIDNSGNVTSTGKIQGNSLKAHVGTDDGSQLNLFADASGHCFIAGHTLRFNVGANGARTTKLYIDSSGNAAFSGNISTTGSITAGAAGVTTQDHRVPAGAGYITYSPGNGATDTLTIRKYGTTQQLFDNDGVQFPNGKVRVNTTTTAWVDANDQFITNGRGVFRGYGHSPLALGRYNSAGSAGEAGAICAFLYGGQGVGSVSITTNSTQYNTTSDVRLKENIKTIVDGSSKIMAMNPVSHTWKANPTEDAVHGFIAQEMKDIVPESVTGEPEGEEMMQMDYGRITPVIVAGLQDALKEIKELKNRIHELENR